MEFYFAGRFKDGRIFRLMIICLISCTLLLALVHAIYRLVYWWFIAIELAGLS